MGSYETKKCICKLCKEQNNGNNGDEQQVFPSIHEGKRHVYLFHRIPFVKGRDYLENAPPRQQHQVIITKLGRL